MLASVETTPILPGLSPVAGKPILAWFDGDLLSSDGGQLALRETEQRLGIARRLGACIEDPPIRPERSVPNSITSVRIDIARAISRTLPRCPCCQQILDRRNL